jgi:hypothetical protein
MSVGISLVQSSVIGGQTDKYLQLGGRAWCRQIESQFVGGWDELWVGVHWHFRLLIDPSKLPLSSSDQSIKHELFWAFGMQVGTSQSWNAGPGSIDHLLGIKAQAFSSTDTIAGETAGGKKWLRSRYQGLLVENGSESMVSPIGDFYWPLEDDIRNMAILRYVRGVPNWDMWLLRSDETLGIETDYSVSDINQLLTDNATWAELVAELQPSGYDEVHVFSGQAIDPTTYGEFNAPFLSWHPRFLECKNRLIYGVTK